jgi:hypothetical protein
MSSLEWWQTKVRYFRRLAKGWSANIDAEIRKHTHGGKSDDGNGANPDLPKDPGNGNLSNPGGNQTGNQYTQRSSGTEGSKRILHGVSVLKGEEIFSLLLQTGAIGSTDQFQWCEKVSEEVL